MAEKNEIVLFSLSTCNACKKTKALLDSNNVEYINVDLDTVDVDSRDKLLEKVRKYNPRETFPTLVISGGEKVVVGFSKEEITEALELG